MLSVYIPHESHCNYFFTLPKSIGDLGFQDFHQRTLSASSSATAKLRCYAAAFLIPIFGIPPVLIGAVAASTGKAVITVIMEIDATQRTSTLSMLSVTITSFTHTGCHWILHLSSSQTGTWPRTVHRLHLNEVRRVWFYPSPCST